MANQPPPLYEQGLESYLFKPLREEWINIMQEAKNSATGNIWFKHVSTWWEQPQELLKDHQFPAVFTLTPNAEIEQHGMKQLKLVLTLQFEYYCKHMKRSVTNELEHFVERLLYLIQTHPSVKFGKMYGGKQLCAKKTAYDSGSLEFDFFIGGTHVIRNVTLTATTDIPLLMIEPP